MYGITFLSYVSSTIKYAHVHIILFLMYQLPLSQCKWLFTNSRVVQAALNEKQNKGRSKGWHLWAKQQAHKTAPMCESF